jgi:hypothetical protein
VTGLLVVALAATAVFASGCSLFGEGEPEYDTVTEYNGRYHFLVPAGWQSVSDPSLLAVYASEELPAEDEALDVLSIVVLNGEESTEYETAEMLQEFVENRGESREWQEAEISEAAAASVGDREGFMIEVSALDSAGVPFQARFYQVRTNGTDFVIVGVMPGDEWGQAGEELDGILERWFWHMPAEESAEDTATANDGEPVDEDAAE